MTKKNKLLFLILSIFTLVLASCQTTPQEEKCVEPIIFKAD